MYNIYDAHHRKLKFVYITNLKYIFDMAFKQFMLLKVPKKSQLAFFFKCQNLIKVR